VSRRDEPSGILALAQLWRGYKFNLARHVTSRHDTFDVSSASRRACRAVLFDKLDTAKVHGLNTSNVSRRDEPSGILALAQLWRGYKFNLARHVTSRHDTTRSTCRARRDERVEPRCLTSSTQPELYGLSCVDIFARGCSRD